MFPLLWPGGQKRLNVECLSKNSSVSSKYKVNEMQLLFFPYYATRRNRKNVLSYFSQMKREKTKLLPPRIEIPIFPLAAVILVTHLGKYCTLCHLSSAPEKAISFSLSLSSQLWIPWKVRDGEGKRGGRKLAVEKEKLVKGNLLFKQSFSLKLYEVHLEPQNEKK